MNSSGYLSPTPPKDASQEQRQPAPLPPRPRTRLPDSPIPRLTILSAAEEALLFGPNHIPISAEIPGTESQEDQRLERERLLYKDQLWYNAKKARVTAKNKAKYQEKYQEKMQTQARDEARVTANNDSYGDANSGDDSDDVVELAAQCHVCKLRFPRRDPDLTGHMWEEHRMFPTSAVQQGLLSKTFAEAAEKMDAAQALLQLRNSSK